MYYHDFFYDSQLPLPGRGGTVDLMSAGGEVEGSRHTVITDPRQFHASGIFVCAILHIKQSGYTPSHNHVNIYLPGTGAPSVSPPVPRHTVSSSTEGDLQFLALSHCYRTCASVRVCVT